jgi:hypothetical protein
MGSANRVNEQLYAKECHHGAGPPLAQHLRKVMNLSFQSPFHPTREVFQPFFALHVRLDRLVRAGEPLL